MNVSDTIYVFGIDCRVKPFPKLVEEHRRLFENVEKVLDIGAGHGRFMKWFLTNTNVRRYVAIEPCIKFLADLRAVAKPYEQKVNVEIVPKPWQEVRDRYLAETWDVIVFWDVLMFLDMRKVHNVDDFLEAGIRELCTLVQKCRYLLFSMYPVQSGLPKLNLLEKVEIIQNGKKVKKVRQNTRLIRQIAEEVCKRTGAKIKAKSNNSQNFIIQGLLN